MTTIAALITAESLPKSYTKTITKTWVPLAAHLAALHTRAARPLLIGINGPQGSGKSTACRFLEHLLTAVHGLTAATLSLDDVYHTRAARADLAKSIHPLLITRGPPGTHDLSLAHPVITRLLTGRTPVAVPRFDKAIDDRASPESWPLTAAPLDILLFEGWCIGATPQPESALATPLNALESTEDPQITWRRHVNTVLATDYAALFARLDLLIALQPPDFAVIRRWRHLQETKLRARAGPDAGMTRAQLDRFLQHYERLTRHMLATLEADIIIPISARRRTGAIRITNRAGM